MKLFAIMAVILLGSAAQGLTFLSSTQSADSTRALQPAGAQQLNATFWIQGDDVDLGQLSINHTTNLKGLSNQVLQASDAGYQAQLLLNTTFSAQIDGAPGQSDAVGALQSLVAAAAIQGYSTIPSGSYLKFIHTLDFSQQPLPKNAAQITDLYTLQDIPLGLSSTASATGLWKPAQGTAPKVIAPKVIVPKMTVPKVTTPPKPRAAPSGQTTPAAPQNKAGKGGF